MIPQNVILFPFAGYGPELSRGLAAVTEDGRVVLADAAGNPGTSVTNAIETAADSALEMLGLGDDTTVLLWTPDDPVLPDSVWRVSFDIDGTSWDQVDATGDTRLSTAVGALRKAAGR